MTGIIFKELGLNYLIMILYRSKSPAILFAENFGWNPKIKSIHQPSQVFETCKVSKSDNIVLKKSNKEQKITLKIVNLRYGHRYSK